MIYTRTQVDRFWNNVAVGLAGECWPWKLSQHSNGYGQVGLRVDGKDRMLKAHKVAWEIHNDQQLTLFERVSHSCDNKLCCNPRHVIMLTSSSNRIVPFGPRAARGEKHGNSKLTDRQVSIIKYRLNALTTREIATAFSVASNTIWDIRKGITWRHV